MVASQRRPESINEICGARGSIRYKANVEDGNHKTKWQYYNLGTQHGMKQSIYNNGATRQIEKSMFSISTPISKEPLIIVREKM